VDDLWAAKSEDAGLLFVHYWFPRFSTYMVMIHQRYRQTDRQTGRQTDDTR